MASLCIDFRGDTNMSQEAQGKLDRLTQLREDARLLELELQQDLEKHREAAGSPKQLSNANTPRGKTGKTALRLPRRTKAAAASTNRVVKLVQNQICANYNTIQLIFNRNDVQNSGKVDKRELLDVMQRCNIPMTEQQASEIMHLLEQDDQGRILYRDFLSIFYVQMPRLHGESDRPYTSMHAASASLPAVSRICTPRAMANSDGARPGTNAANFSINASQNVRDRPTTGTRASMVYGGNLSATRIALIAMLNEFVRDNKHKLEEMFEMSDLDSRGSVSKHELVRILHAAGFSLTMEEIDDTLDVLSQKAPRGYVDYKMLLSKLSTLTFDMPEIFESLTSVHFAPTHLSQVVGNRVRDAYHRVLMCLGEEDSEGSGIVSHAAVLRILKGIGLEISLQALSEVLRKSGLPIHTQYINLHHLIQRFVPTHRPPSVGRYAELAERARIPKEIHNAPSMNSDQLLQRLKEKMEDHIKYPREMFLKLDTDKDGTLTKDELQKAFSHFNLYPKAADVDALFETVDVHKKGRIGYGEFLEMLVPRGDMKPSMYHDSFKSYMRKGSFYSLVPQGVAPIRLGTHGKMTPLGKLSLADIQQVIRKKLGSQHQSMQSLLQHRDPDGTGFVSKNLLLQVLRKLDVFISHSQLEEVLVAQGIASHGERVKLSEFMAAFLLKNTGRAASGAQTHRPATRAPVHRPATRAPVDRAELLERIRSKLHGRWEDVQKAFFEEQDQSLEFKVGRVEVSRILSKFGVPISQDQDTVLFHGCGDHIDYLDFLKLLDLDSRRSTAASARLRTGNLFQAIGGKGTQVEMISPSRRGTSRGFRQ